MYSFPTHICILLPLIIIRFGRGYAISAHPGNQVLRSLVRAHKIAHKMKKNEKRDVGRKIVYDIQHKLGGAFLMLMKDDLNGKSSSDKDMINEKVWVKVDTDKAVGKGE